MSSVRRAAGIIVHRGDRTDLEVLLVERDPRLRFFGGFFAFPGGVLEVDDSTGVPLDEAFRSCAVRELFEETGVLLVPDAVAPEARSEIRQGLASRTPDPAATARWSAIDTTGAPLTSVMQITTPEFTPQRYQTEFFLASLPDGERVDVWPGELVGGEFIAPARALEDWRAGRRLIAPPVLLLLELIARHGVAGLPGAAREEQVALEAGRLHPVRFAPGIFTAPLRTATLPPATTTNTFLLGGERVLIIDPAPRDPGEQRRLFDKVDAVRAAGAELLAIALTHHHPDHVGAAEETSARYGLPVWAHPETLSRLDLTMDTRPLDDGARIELGRAPDGSDGWTVTALHTPGHAPGHLAFVESRYRGAVVGDLLSAISTIVIDPPDGHLATYLASLEKLKAFGVAMVHPSHGPAVRTGESMIDHFLAHRHERHAKVRSALAGSAQSLEDLLPRVYEDTDPALWSLARRSLLAHLIALEEASEVERVGESWRRRETS